MFRSLFHRQGFTYDYVFDWNMLKFVSWSLFIHCIVFTVILHREHPVWDRRRLEGSAVTPPAWLSLWALHSRLKLASKQVQEQVEGPRLAPPDTKSLQQVLLVTLLLDS